MKIIIDEKSFQQGKSNITGIVYFSTENHCQFPCEGWNDFVVVIATWWLRALDDLDDLKATTKLLFMDGPYWVNLRHVDPDHLWVEFFEDRKGCGVIETFTINKIDFFEMVLDFANRISKVCESKSFVSDDLKELRRVIKNNYIDNLPKGVKHG